MNIHFTDPTGQDAIGNIFPYKFRIQPFVSTLEQLYPVSYSTGISFSNNKNSIWFLDCFQEIPMKNFIKKNRNFIMDFKGKVVLYTTDDFGMHLTHTIAEKEVVERIDAFVYGNRFGTSCKFDIFKKSILIPRFFCQGEEWQKTYYKKSLKNIKCRLFFRGLATNIIRIKGIGMIKEIFNDEVLDVGIYSTPEHDSIEHQFIHKSYYNDIRVEYLFPKEFRKVLGESLISICFPGLTSWCVRQIESMATSTAVISCPIDGIYDNDWLYMEKVKDLFFYIKEDLTDLIEVCSYCLNNFNICIERGREGYEIYKKYFELNSDDTYKENVWNDIRSQFLNLNIPMGELI